MCPMQQQAMMMMMRMNASMSMNSMMMMMNQMGGSAMPGGASGASRSSSSSAEGTIMAGEGRESIIRRMTMMSSMSSMPMSMSMDCVGDMNCPGTMKCCSHDMSVYYPMHNQGGQVMMNSMNMMHNGYGMRNMNPTHGYCMEPVMMNNNAPAAEANKM